MTDRLSELWLRTLENVVALAAHDIRGPLNAIAVNVEVVRTRSAAGAGAEAVSPFAAAAAGQVELLAGRIEALLALARDSAADAAAVAARLVRLLASPAAMAGGSLTLEQGVDSAPAAVAAGSRVVKLALGEALLSAARSGAVLTCRVDAAPAPRVCISGASLRISPEVADVLRREGVILQQNGDELIIEFPSD